MSKEKIEKTVADRPGIRPSIHKKPNPEKQEAQAEGGGNTAVSRAKESRHLQRKMGNSRLGKLWGQIQTKLRVGSAHSPQEREADQVARRVVDHSHQQQNAPIQRMANPEEEQTAQTKALQRMGAEEEEAGLQKMSDEEESAPLQKKGVDEEDSAIQKMSSEEEEPVQRMASEEEEPVQRQSVDDEEPVQRMTSDEEDPVQRMSAEEEPVQRMGKPEEEEGTAVQTKKQLGASTTAPKNVEHGIQQAKGKGHTLPDHVRQPMESGMNADFSQVRIHTDDRANQLNDQVQARAFTTGKDIFFKQGEYNPESRTGKELLAHELTHVVQQDEHVISRKVSASYPKIRSNLTYKWYDWFITDNDAKEVLNILQRLDAKDLRDTVQKMKKEGLFPRFLDNLSASDLQNYQNQVAPLLAQADSQSDSSTTSSKTKAVPAKTPSKSAPKVVVSPIPPYGMMEGSYPKGNADDVKKKIGGKVNYGWIKNTCAIRMSRALNYAGHEIPKSKQLNSVSGADGKRYAFRVRQLKSYLIEQFGQPTLVYLNSNKSGKVPDNFKGVKGIIVFEVDSWNDATGHITLWNGSSCVDNDCYWKEAKKVELWVSP